MQHWKIIDTFHHDLPKNSVILFLVHLNDFFPQLKQLYNLLNSTEQQKALRFHFEKHQQRYTVSQAFLRIFLSNYSNTKPIEIEFKTTSFGKPFLSNSNLQFNISHSNEYALYGFSYHTAIGVDIEYWRERKYFDGIIDANFSQKEQAIYHSLDDELKTASFYQGWTCNEAYIKAIGMGLSFPLSDFTVEMDPTKPAKLLHTIPRTDVKTDWHIQKIPCPDDYSAALAIEKPCEDLRLYLLNPDFCIDFD